MGTIIKAPGNQVRENCPIYGLVNETRTELVEEEDETASELTDGSTVPAVSEEVCLQWTDAEHPCQDII